MGFVPGSIYLLSTVVFQLFFENKSDLLLYNAALLSTAFMLLLGFIDDVLDLKWRYKLIIPLFAAIPLAVTYADSTNIRVPLIFASILGGIIDLGKLYYLYLILLTVFTSNSINIYAGINGLEVGQSIVICLSCIFWNIYGIVLNENVDGNTFSISLLIPFVFASLALFKYNKYPSRCFVGDTYCYFAGMVFATASIIGKYPLMVLLFFVPQLLNFLFSLPQLLGFLPITRHRLPRFNEETGMLEGQVQHKNLINITLRLIGPRTEYDLVNILLIFQLVASFLMVLLRITAFHLVF